MQTQTNEIWYYNFDRHIEEIGLVYETLYDPRLKQWFQYTDGYYHETQLQQIRAVIYDWGMLVNENLNNNKVSFLIKRLEAQCLFTGVWDPDPNIDNCLDGLIDKTTRKIHKHSAEYKSRQQIPRHYIESEGIIPPLFEKLLSIIPDDDERMWFIQYMINIVHNYHDDELFCILYGPKGGGKSTILKIPELLFGQLAVSKTPLQRIGKRFGLKEIHDKRLNINPDLPIVPMSDYTISLLKQLTGNDGLIEVELKGRDSFMYPIKCFLLFGINQLMEFSSKSEKEIESIFRRSLLVNLPNTLKRNPQFKRDLEDPKFLDELYSWLIWMRPRAIIGDGEDELDNWIEIQKTKWLNNANPILAICRELFCYNESMTLPVRHVQETIMEELQGAGIMKSQQVQTNITQALQTMKIYRDNKRGLNAHYVNIEEVMEEYK